MVTWQPSSRAVDATSPAVNPPPITTTLPLPLVDAALQRDGVAHGAQHVHPRVVRGAPDRCLGLARRSRSPGVYIRSSPASSTHVVPASSFITYAPRRQIASSGT